jgi:uncharacterized membrane-anchored protein YitT (DUF2179 family)
MDTNAESSMRNKIVEYVKQYALITLSISIMSVGVYFFKFPNNFVFGGVTGMAALAAKLTPLSASAFSSAANMILLGVGLVFLGKKFAMTTGYATVVMSLELMVLEKICPLRGPLSDQPMLDLLFAIALPAIASALLFNVGASSGGANGLHVAILIRGLMPESIWSQKQLVANFMRYRQSSTLKAPNCVSTILAPSLQPLARSISLAG